MYVALEVDLLDIYYCVVMLKVLMYDCGGEIFMHAVYQ